MPLHRFLKSKIIYPPQSGRKKHKYKTPFDYFDRRRKLDEEENAKKKVHHHKKKR